MIPTPGKLFFQYRTSGCKFGTLSMQMRKVNRRRLKKQKCEGKPQGMEAREGLTGGCIKVSNSSNPPEVSCRAPAIKRSIVEPASHQKASTRAKPSSELQPSNLPRFSEHTNILPSALERF